MHLEVTYYVSIFRLGDILSEGYSWIRLDIGMEEYTEMVTYWGEITYFGWIIWVR